MSSSNSGALESRIVVRLTTVLDPTETASRVRKELFVGGDSATMSVAAIRRKRQ